jgi:hypothetical protein
VTFETTCSHSSFAVVICGVPLENKFAILTARAILRRVGTATRTLLQTCKERRISLPVISSAGATSAPSIKLGRTKSQPFHVNAGVSRLSPEDATFGSERITAMRSLQHPPVAGARLRFPNLLSDKGH